MISLDVLLDVFIGLCLFLFFILILFAEPVSELILAKAEEIRARAEKLRQENEHSIHERK